MAVVTTPGATQNSYATVAEFKTYCDDRGMDYSAYSDAAIGESLILTALWLDGYMDGRMPGVREAAVNALAWPRSQATDSDGYDLTDIPTRVQYAHIEAAFYNLGNAGNLFKTYTPYQQKVLVQVDAIKWQPISGGNQTGARASRIILPQVEDLLAPILTSGKGYPVAFAI